MAGSKPSSGMVAANGVAKIIALAVGAVTALLGTMSLMGAFTANTWIRFVVALLLLIVLPAVIVDRLLPENEPERAKGLPTDVFAVMWLGTGLLFVGLGSTATRSLLVREGDRLSGAQMFGLGQLCYTMAGVRKQSAPTREASTTQASNPGDTHNTTPDSGLTAHATTPDAGTEQATDAQIASADAGERPSGPRPEQSPAELFRNYAPAVVAISVRGSHGMGGGTGFVIDRQGTIVTNHHVIDDAAEIKIRLFDGTEITEIDLLSDDENNDLALLRLHTSHALTVASLGNSETVVVGERATAIGNPLGLDYTLTDGLISARRLWHGKPMIQFSVPVSPGNSGGPLFNSRGEVIGIVTLQAAGPFERAQNLNLAVPINVAKAMIQPNYPNRRRVGDPTAPAGRW